LELNLDGKSHQIGMGAPKLETEEYRRRHDAMRQLMLEAM